MKNLITYWLKRSIFLVLILVQVGNVYGAAEVLAGTEIEGVESVVGYDKIRSWGIVKDFDDAIKLSTTNLEKLAKYIADEGVDITKLQNSAKGITDPAIMQKWIDLKLPRNKLDELYVGIKNDPPANIDPWTPDHKAQRWNNYKEGNGELSFESWSNVYDGNIKKAVNGNKKVKEYATQNGLDIPDSGFERVWKDPITDKNKKISIELRGEPVEGLIRHDIYDGDLDKAIEIKNYTTQNVSKSYDIEKEALMDIELLKSGYITEIEWIFLGNGPSGPLRELLIAGGIKILP